MKRLKSIINGNDCIIRKYLERKQQQLHTMTTFPSHSLRQTDNFRFTSSMLFLSKFTMHWEKMFFLHTREWEKIRERKERERARERIFILVFMTFSLTRNIVFVLMSGKIFIIGQLADRIFISSCTTHFFVNENAESFQSSSARRVDRLKNCESSRSGIEEKSVWEKSHFKWK